MYEASSEARNREALTTSSMRPARPMGMALISFLRTSGSPVSFDVRIGGMTPGCTEFTRMPSFAPAHSMAIDLANSRTPPLVAQ